MRTWTLISALTIACLASEQKLQFDIVFLIDGSQTAETSFDSFTKFIQTLMLPYNVGMNGARVGLTVLAPDLDDQAPPAALLNSITNQRSLNSYLAILKENYADFDNAGQILNYNLQVVNSSDFKSSGYRTNINNHVLVYITSTTSFDTSPTLTAKTIIAQKHYGIITIGYGTNVDHEKLREISGGKGCSYTALNYTQLMDNIKPVQRLIMHADANKGVYCTHK